MENTDVIINEEIFDFKWVTLEEFNELSPIEGLEEEALHVFFLILNKNK